MAEIDFRGHIEIKLQRNERIFVNQLEKLCRKYAVNKKAYYFRFD